MDTELQTKQEDFFENKNKIISLTGQQHSNLDKDNEYFDVYSKQLYIGPIVQGWPPNINRSVPNYIQAKDPSQFLILPDKEKMENCSILITVHSSPGKSM